jgi:ribonuclease R
LPDMERGELAEIAARISAAERRAMVAERETVDRLIAGWLSEQIGASFKGRIGGVTKSGIFVKLLDTGADGFIPASTLGADYYRYEESAHALIGNRTGETFRIGDIVEVKLVEAAPFAGALRFEMLSDGVSRKTLGLSRGKGGRDTKSSRRNGPKPSSRGAKKKHRG